MKDIFLENDVKNINDGTPKEIDKNKRIFMSDLRKDFLTKNKVCLLCGKKMIGDVCCSHTIPQFVLKNIADNGEVLTGNNIGNALLKSKSGIGIALTFKLICQECDSYRFQDYEKSDLSLESFTQDALREIVKKNYLRLIYKSDEFLNYFISISNRIKHDSLPYLCHMELFNMECYYKLFKETDKSKFYIIDKFELPYNTCMAFQSTIALKTGFDGELINGLGKYNTKIDDFRSEKLIKYLIDNYYNHLHLSIYPLGDRTEVILFIKDGNTKYRKFYKNYRKLSFEEKLYVLNYIILLYSEEYAINPKSYMNHKISNETLEVLKTTTNYSPKFYEKEARTIDEKELISETISRFKLKTSGNVDNFLSKKMANNNDESKV